LTLLKVVLFNELCHWYTGEVPFCGATPESIIGAVFAQIVWFALIEPTASVGNTVIVMVFDVAGFPVMQEAFEVSTHATVLPLAGIKE
jgi:hypothetical protein